MLVACLPLNVPKEAFNHCSDFHCTASRNERLRFIPCARPPNPRQKKEHYATKQCFTSQAWYSCRGGTPKKKKGEGDEATSRGPAFQVTAHGEEGHGKKQGLDYLFELYQEAGRILEEIREQEKATGKKPSAKVRLRTALRHSFANPRVWKTSRMLRVC